MSRRATARSGTVIAVAALVAAVLGCCCAEVTRQTAAWVAASAPRVPPRAAIVARRAVAPEGGDKEAAEDKAGAGSAPEAKEGQGEKEEKKDLLEDILGLRRQLFEEGALFNPARTFARREAIEIGAQVSEVGSAATLFIVGLEKAGMVSRTAEGLTPLDDSVVVEQAGRLVPVVSGFLWPAAQLAALFLCALAVTIALLEELQRDQLQAMDVDVDTQRRRRLASVAFLASCVLLMVSPPIPGVTEV